MIHDSQFTVHDSQRERRGGREGRRKEGREGKRE